MEYTIGSSVGVADVVSEMYAFPANITFSHDNDLLKQWYFTKC